MLKMLEGMRKEEQGKKKGVKLMRWCCYCHGNDFGTEWRSEE